MAASNRLSGRRYKSGALRDAAQDNLNHLLTKLWSEAGLDIGPASNRKKAANRRHDIFSHDLK
jgi:hypothetical protein